LVRRGPSIIIELSSTALVTIPVSFPPHPAFILRHPGAGGELERYIKRDNAYNETPRVHNFDIQLRTEQRSAAAAAVRVGREGERARCRP